MKSHIIALAALVVIGLAGAALAGEATKGPKAMTDAEMDAVTAGEFRYALITEISIPALDAHTPPTDTPLTGSIQIVRPSPFPDAALQALRADAPVASITPLQ